MLLSAITISGCNLDSDFKGGKSYSVRDSSNIISIDSLPEDTVLNELNSRNVGPKTSVKIETDW